MQDGFEADAIMSTLNHLETLEFLGVWGTPAFFLCSLYTLFVVPLFVRHGY